MDIEAYTPQAEWKYNEGDKMSCLDGEVKVYRNGKWQHFGYEEKDKDNVEAFRKVLVDMLYNPSSQAYKAYAESGLAFEPYLGFAPIKKEKE